MTITISNKETPCTHEASDVRFNLGQIMQCIVKHATGIYL